MANLKSLAVCLVGALVLHGGVTVSVASAQTAKKKTAEKSAKSKPIPVKQQFGFVAGPASLKPSSFGGFTRGCLAGGARLPDDGPSWQAMRLSRDRHWGHPKLISWIKQFANESKKAGWPGLLVGDISQPRGGPMLTGHRSHQVGRDADIWYRPMPAKRFTFEQRERESAIPLADYRGTEVIAKNWRPGYVGLMKRAASNPNIQRILVHPAVKKKLCQSAGTDRAWLRKVRPVWGHNYHFHVRFYCPECGKTRAGCRGQCDPPKGDGCGAPIDYWMKLLKTPPKPRVGPKKPRKPRPVRTLAWLPKQCRGVLADGKPQVFVNPRSILQAAPPVPARRPKNLVAAN